VKNDEPKPIEEGQSNAIEIEPAILEANTQLLFDSIDAWLQNPTGVNRPGSLTNSFALSADGRMSIDKTLIEMDAGTLVRFDFLPHPVKVVNRPMINESTLTFYPDVRATERMRVAAQITLRSYNIYNATKSVEQVVDESTASE